MAGLIVHEWISKTGGSEKVLDAMVEALPDAKLRCLWNDVPQIRYAGRPVQESWLARTPLRHSKAAAMAFIPICSRYPSLSDADWVLASSHLFAHHIKTRGRVGDIPKFAYVYTPARYIWAPELDVRGAAGLPRLFAPYLQRLDRKRAQESLEIAAISNFVRDRVRQSWGRDCRVIYPPVDVAIIQAVSDWRDKLSPSEGEAIRAIPPGFVLGASRFVSYKRLDLVIKTGEALGLPVVIAGSGPGRREISDLARSASVPVQIIDHPTDRLLYALYQLAALFVFPQLEDFGIMPVEAMAAGTPVLSNLVGGTSETVVNGVTGAHVSWECGPSELRRAAEAAMRVAPERCRERARTFGRDHFTTNLLDWIQPGKVAPKASATS